MKTQSVALAAHYAQAATTIARCWKVTRRDAQVFGFTSHDQALVVSGVTYQASTGISPSAMQQNADLSVANLEVAGFLNSAALTEDDLRAGLWDGAAVEIFEVNWADLTQGRLVLRVGTIGNVTAGRVHFQAELRGLSQALQQPIGRVYAPGCDATLGDARCGVDLGPLTATAAVTEVTDARTFVATSLGGADDYYGAGMVTWLTGANAGQKMEVRTFALGGALVLVLPMPAPIQVGDTFEIVPGCRKHLAACTAFSNVIRFRGFPYVPGNDKVLGSAGNIPEE